MTYDPSPEFPSASERPHAFAEDIEAQFEGEEGSLVGNLIALRGLVGIALGAFEIAQPRKVMEIDGLDENSEPLVRLAGAHKLATGLGMLISADKRPWLTGALAGSAYDAAALITRNANAGAYGRLAAVAGVDATLAVCANLRTLEKLAH